MTVLAVQEMWVCIFVDCGWNNYYLNTIYVALIWCVVGVGVGVGVVQCFVMSRSQEVVNLY